MHKAGYNDEGSFSDIDHDALLEKGLWLPRKARTRIVALAVSLKNRLDTKNRRKSVAKDRLNASMLDGGALKGVSIDGIDEVVTNKRDIKAAYDRKIANEAENERERRFLLQAIEEERLRRLAPLPKKHTNKLSSKGIEEEIF